MTGGWVTSGAACRAASAYPGGSQTRPLNPSGDPRMDCWACAARGAPSRAIAKLRTARRFMVRLLHCEMSAVCYIQRSAFTSYGRFAQGDLGWARLIPGSGLSPSAHVGYLGVFI